MSTFTDAVVEGVRHLERADPQFRVFGAASHRYGFNPPLSERRLRTFEMRWQIELPADYREFLHRVGNGGAGPFYGIFHLGYWDGAGDEERWTPASIGRPHKPFTHRKAWNEPPDWTKAPPQGTAQYDRWLDREDRRYWNPSLLDGSIPICTEGCALRFLLVVSGPEAGNVWHDALAEYKGLSPLGDPGRLTFSEWYLSWLTRSLAALR